MNIERYRKTKIATILYLDDEESSAKIDKINFKQYGLETTIVTESSQAVEKYKEVNPDIVLIDLEFANQEKNGVDLLVDLFRYDKQLADRIVLPNSIHMDEKDDLGFKFWTKYQELTGKEPQAIINKLADNKANDLVWVLGHLIEDRVGESEMNTELKAYMDRRDQEF